MHDMVHDDIGSVLLVCATNETLPMRHAVNWREYRTEPNPLVAFDMSATWPATLHKNWTACRRRTNVCRLVSK